MPEIRMDPLTGDRVIIAPERSHRPNAFVAEAEVELPPENCPFCPGNEAQTPPEIVRVGSPWRLRVVPNKYPAVQCEDIAPPGSTKANATGTHLVIIEAREHVPSIELYDERRLAELIELYGRLYRGEASRPRVRYVSIFKSSGRAAGASIDHPHSQLLSLPFVPDRGLRELRTFERDDGCPLCRLVKTEVSTERWIDGNGDFSLLAPFAARCPYQMWILPNAHRPSFADTDSGELESFVSLLRQALSGLGIRLPGVAFNWSFQSSPLDAGEPSPSFHWYLELTPRLTAMGGFELSSGSSINIVTPEQTAGEMRALLHGTATEARS